MNMRDAKTKKLLIVVLLITFVLNLLGLHLEIPFILRVILSAIIGIVTWIGLRLTWFK